MEDLFPYADGRSAQDTDETGRACMRLLDVLREDLERGTSPEPIELGYSQIEGLCAYVLRDQLVQGSPGLLALYYGTRRYRGDPI